MLLMIPYNFRQKDINLLLYVFSVLTFAQRFMNFRHSLCKQEIALWGPNNYSAYVLFLLCGSNIRKEEIDCMWLFLCCQNFLDENFLLNLAKPTKMDIKLKLSGLMFYPFVRSIMLNIFSHPSHLAYHSYSNESVRHAEEILSVKYEDGKWSKPYYDCGGGNIWMLTYTVPFFGFENGTYFFK